MEESLGKPAPEVLEYCSPPGGLSTVEVRRFQLIYAIGIAVAWIVVVYCWNAIPRRSRPDLIFTTQLEITIQVTGGAACAWLALALRRINNSAAIRRSALTWFLVAANAVVGCVVMPFGYL